MTQPLQAIGAAYPRAVAAPLGSPYAEAMSFEGLSHAFQPIVDIHTGVVHAYEALLRGVERAGCEHIGSFFDRIDGAGRLAETELHLADAAMAQLATLPGRDARLFLNIDERTLEDPAFRPRDYVEAARRHDLQASSLCIEVLGRKRGALGSNAPMLIAALRASQVRLALDHFGHGCAELALLYALQPEYVKVDRFFVADIGRSNRKRLFLATVVNLAHAVGAKVIAEGVETADEHVACREIGCDLAQGYYIARPVPAAEATSAEFRHVLATSTRNRRTRNSDEPLIRSEIDVVPPIRTDQAISTVFDRFRSVPDRAYFPVVDSADVPVGLLHERNFRSFVFNPVGRDILQNDSLGYRIADFVTRCPTADIRMPVEKVLEVYAHWSDADGIVLTEQGVYVGMLSSAALLKLVNEKRLQVAQDQNPLTTLPGNLSINNHLVDAAEATGANRLFCYFDFNHFKPFNDHYGFRQGDRVIILFADILRRHFSEGAFLGHVGGDDFFAGVRGVTLEEVERKARAVTADFRAEVVSFYAPEDHRRGFLEGNDREGNAQIFPLMTCSAAVVEIGEDEVIDDFVGISRRIADAKRAAKLSVDAIAVRPAPRRTPER